MTLVGVAASFAAGIGLLAAAWVVFRRRAAGPEKPMGNFYRFWMSGLLAFAGAYVLLLTTSAAVSR